MCSTMWCSTRPPPATPLRLLSLPKAWTGFLAGNDRGGVVPGPHSGLKMQEARFNAALAALSDPALTTMVLVTRPDPRPMQEAARTALELRALGLATSTWPSTACSMPASRGRTPWPMPSRPWAVKPWTRCPMRWRNCRATRCRCARATPWVCLR
ncbi:MAG: hypothetical protein U1E77_00410 [Inhella sp.]